MGHGGRELLKGKEEPSLLCVWKAKGTLFHKIDECADFDLLKLLGKTQTGGKTLLFHLVILVLISKANYQA